jgi:hypothetical protein
MLLSGLAMAQTHIPYCAKMCIANAIADSTTCGPKDLWCQCSNANLPVIVNASTSCVEKACKDPEGIYSPPEHNLLLTYMKAA